MKSYELLKLTEHLPHFSRADLKGFDLRNKTIEVFLSRSVQSGKIHRLKRGLFVSSSFIEYIKSADQLRAYKEFLANVLVTPSYISLEYALSKHELISEAVYSITCVTTGRPVLIENDFGNFRYRNTSNQLLSQFETIQEGIFQIKIANKVQALFDYLYLKKKELRILSLETIKELRLNFHLLSPDEICQLKERSKESRSLSMQKTMRFIEVLHANQ